MLLAYLDEVGEAGAFVAKDHPRFNTSPAFGYAGFVVPASASRRFGEWFTKRKRTVFATEIATSPDPARWERKGSSIFRAQTHERYPQQIRVFNSLVHKLRSVGGNLFYYVEEKPLGTPKQTRLDLEARERGVMRETINRLARHADGRGEHILILMDQVNEKQRVARMPAMYAHLFSRAGDFAEMKKVVEPPMHLDSQVSSNIQFADWVAACVSRAVEHQLIENSDQAWIVGPAVDAVRGSFTRESKLHLRDRSIKDFHHSDTFRSLRPLYPTVDGQRLGASMPAEALRRLRGAMDRR